MKRYAMFIKQFDCEIHISLTEGDESSLEYVRDDIIEHLTAFPKDEKGYCEQYPFYMADWEIVGYKLPSDLDYSKYEELA